MFIDILFYIDQWSKTNGNNISVHVALPCLWSMVKCHATQHKNICYTPWHLDAFTCPQLVRAYTSWRQLIASKPVRKWMKAINLFQGSACGGGCCSRCSCWSWFVNPRWRMWVSKVDTTGQNSTNLKEVTMLFLGFAAFVVIWGVGSSCWLTEAAVIERLTEPQYYLKWCQNIYSVLYRSPTGTQSIENHRLRK